jgi:hypothetical protein
LLEQRYWPLLRCCIRIVLSLLMHVISLRIVKNALAFSLMLHRKRNVTLPIIERSMIKCSILRVYSVELVEHGSNCHC